MRKCDFCKNELSYRHLTAGKRVWKAKHWETNRC